MKYFLNLKIIFLSVSVFFGKTEAVLSQSLVYYPFNSVLGFGSNPEKVFWLDLKLQTNSYFSSLSTELSPQFTIKNTTNVLYYLGGGLKINYLNAIENKNLLEGYFINTGVRIKPIRNNQKVHIAFELSPYVARKLDLGVFRSQLGIGYNFSEKK